MVRTTKLRLAPFALAGAVLFAQPAQAAMGMIAMPVAVTSALAAVDACPVSGGSPAAMLSAATMTTSQSKAAALLGGQVSQLELMRRQQAGLSATPGPQMAGISPVAVPEPGVGVSPLAVLRGAGCGSGPGFAVRGAQPATGFAASLPRPAVLSPDDYLASKRLAVSQTHFDKDWNRVRSSGLSRSLAAAAGSRRGTVDLEALGQVNRWANAHVRYVEDRELYGKADHWATASETLRRRAGDCEDIAIVKMQLLAAQGVNREDMHLVIARDLTRAADHALLVVRIDGRNWLLDNVTDQVLDASEGYEYRPILSYSQNRKWLHGY